MTKKKEKDPAVQAGEEVKSESTVVETPLSTAAEDQWKIDWNARVGAFATAIAKPQVDVETKLEAVVGTPSAQALEALVDAEASPNNDLKTALAGLNIPSAIFNKNVDLLRGPKVTVITLAGDGKNKLGDTSPLSSAVLPQVPNEESFLQMLLVGGVLKVGVAEVIAAIKAGLANRVGFFDLPTLLRDKMEEFAETSEEPCGADYFKLRTLIAKRRYSDVLSALGIEGQFMSERKKNDFLNKIDVLLWPTLHSFHTQLEAWNQSWMQTAGNPAAFMAIMAANMSGGGGVLPAGMVAPPDTSPVRDAAATTINNINKVFAGPGIPIARALAYDANQIRSILEQPGLPVAVGSTTRDLMLKMLGVNVNPDDVRLETNLARFALSIMELPKVTAGQDELFYFGALYQLGMTIPWKNLNSLSSTTGHKTVSKKPFEDEPEDDNRHRRY